MAEGFLVRDVMTSSVTTIPRDAPLLVAAITMRRDSIRHIPVVEVDKLVGVITERDILRCSPSLLSNIGQDEYNAIFENTLVERVMNRTPKTIPPDLPIRDAIALMIEHKVGCLPVVEGESIVGILTRSDLIHLLARMIDGLAVSA